MPCTPQPSFFPDRIRGTVTNRGNASPNKRKSLLATQRACEANPDGRAKRILANDHGNRMLSTSNSIYSTTTTTTLANINGKCQCSTTVFICLPTCTVPCSLSSLLPSHDCCRHRRRRRCSCSILELFVCFHLPVTNRDVAHRPLKSASNSVQKWWSAPRRELSSLRIVMLLSFARFACCSYVQRSDFGLFGNYLLLLIGTSYAYYAQSHRASEKGTYRLFFMLVLYLCKSVFVIVLNSASF